MHGTPNGPEVFYEYIKLFTEIEFIPIVINFKTGISIADNVVKLKEIIDAYPKNAIKGMMCHDNGLITTMNYLNEYENPFNFLILCGFYHRISFENIVKVNFVTTLYQLGLRFLYAIKEIPYIEKIVPMIYDIESMANPDPTIDIKLFDDYNKLYYYTWINGIFLIVLKIISFISPYWAYIGQYYVYEIHYSNHKYIKNIKKSDLLCLIDNNEFDLLFLSDKIKKEYLKINSNNRIKEYKNNNHWFYLIKPEEKFRDIVKFLKDNKYYPE